MIMVLGRLGVNGMSPVNTGLRTVIFCYNPKVSREISVVQKESAFTWEQTGW